MSTTQSISKDLYSARDNIVPTHGDCMKFSDTAMTIMKNRYLADGETPDMMFARVAKNVAQNDKEFESAFYHIMRELKFLPSSPTLMNAGRRLQMLSSCFVVPIEDSIESIFEAVKTSAIIHRAGGGTGFSFSKLRHKDAPVRSTNGKSSGPVSFMKVFNAVTECVKQGGVRRGANIAVLRSDHPDIIRFAKCKLDDGVLNNFNISVAVDDKFMHEVRRNGFYDLHDHTGKVHNTLPAMMIMDEIVHSAWSGGEPGLLFIDEINRKNKHSDVGRIEAVNPCGELPLFANEACNLGSINLSMFVDDYEIMWPELGAVVKLAIRFLDDVIDVNKYPTHAIEKVTKLNRKIGLGVMGFADMLIKLGVKYNSEIAIEIAESVMNFILHNAVDASVKLADERGVFPNHELSRWEHEMRNGSLLSIAPTGSISIIAGCSSSLEPIFATKIDRNISIGKFNDEHPLLGEYERELFVTAHDVPPEMHVKMQAAFQRYVDSSVSKTVNLPHDATPADVRSIFMLAYDLKCKGITLYRDGSRDGQVLSRCAECESGVCRYG